MNCWQQPTRLYADQRSGRNRIALAESDDAGQGRGSRSCGRPEGKGAMADILHPGGGHGSPALRWVRPCDSNRRRRRPFLTTK